MNDESNKPTAFVIQMFDSGKFDRRYHETIRPALVKAGADPQRADQILGLQPVIQKIEHAIRNASICIAEVSTDNPNVWLELGFALALDRPTVILCDRQQRERLPFDIQHRPVILYSTESKSGYEDLEEKIVAEVKNQLHVAARVESSPVLRSGASDTKDLKGYEIAILSALVALWPASPDGVVYAEFSKKLSRSGYSETQIGLGITKLIETGYLEQQTARDEQYDSEYFTYRITPEGMRWLYQNEDAIKPLDEAKPRTLSAQNDFVDDDIPF